MIAVQRIGHATCETPDLALQLDYYTQVIDPRPWHEDRPQRPKIWKQEDGAMVWGVPPASDYLRSRPPMPGH